MVIVVLVQEQIRELFDFLVFEVELIEGKVFFTHMV